MGSFFLKHRFGNFKDGLHDSLRGKWSGHSDWYVSERWEWFYRIKALICLLLSLQPKGDTQVYEHVLVTVTDSGTGYVPGEPTYHWYEGLIVGHGVLSNWWAAYYGDSD